MMTTMMMADTRGKDRIRRRSGEELYQITWDSNGNAISTPTTQQQQQQEPWQQLSFNSTTSSTTIVWSYTYFLGGCLLMWWLYLLLPRGFRKQFCHGQRRHYARRTDRSMPAGGYWLPANKSMDSTSDHGSHSTIPRFGFSPASTTTNTTTARSPHTPPRNANNNHNNNNNSNARRHRANPPSPEHPALLKIPPNRIIAETMGRLQGRGIRLVAHGVHCDPKRVWIKLEDDTASVTWQTEFPRRVPNQAGHVSIVLMRGSLHRVALCNVLYIDVGKKTNALQRHNPQIKVPDATCFSLLTQNGSLDLQTNSKLERDALVSCFSMILDDVHEEDWRALYEASPENSMVSGYGNGNGNGRAEPRNQGTEVAYQSDLMVEI
jgi:hypothetical protein